MQGLRRSLWLLLIVATTKGCLALNLDDKLTTISINLDDEVPQVEQQVQELEALDEQAEMLVTRTNQTIGDFSDVVNSELSVDDLKIKYAAKESALKVLADAMNHTADRCNDFYAYSCGGWLNETQIPSDTSRWSKTFSAIHRSNLDVLRAILNGSNDTAYPPTKLPTDRVSKVRNLYASCMNMERRNTEGMTGVMPLVNEVLATTTPEELLGVMGELGLSGISTSPFSFGVGADDRNPGWNVAFASQGGLGLPDISYYSSTEAKLSDAREKYTALLNDLFGLVSYTGSAADVLAFETKLAGFSLTREQRRDPVATYNPTTLGEWAESNPALEPFVAVFNSNFNSYGSDAKLVVEAPAYFGNLSAVLSETPLEHLQSYVVSKILLHLAAYTTDEAGALNFEFYGKLLNGIEERPALWKRCVATTQDNLWQLSDQIFIERTFAGESTTIANTMIDYIKKAFGELLEQNKWMDQTTKKKAALKLDAMDRKIGAPLMWEKYETLDIGGEFLENILAANKWHAHDHYKKMGKKKDRFKWGMHASTVNAYYSPTMNEMCFPAGILQPPFFSKDAPMVLNFGSIGAVMGHELTHGFDDQGAQYDASGAMRNWWTHTSQKRFDQRKRCFVDQYEGFKIPGLDPSIRVNGKLTLGENLADNGGVALALTAYKQWAVENGGPSLFKMEGKTYTDEHLFWVAYGQTWCAKQTAESKAQQVLTDPHSPGVLRVWGPIQNSPTFNDEFQCSEMSRMNPRNKCSLWQE